MEGSNMLIIAGVGAAILFMTTASSAAPTVGTIDIVSCPTNIDIQADQSAEISISVKAINGNASKTLQIVAGDYTDSRAVTLNKDQTDVITFTIPNVTASISYTVSVI